MEGEREREVRRKEEEEEIEVEGAPFARSPAVSALADDRTSSDRRDWNESSSLFLPLSLLALFSFP